jgi:AraC-like DNA-binding protein
MKTYSFADLGYHEDFPFMLQWANVEAGFAMHGHSFSELVIVLSGSGTNVTETESYPLSRGDVFVLNGESVHGFENSNHLALCNLMYDPVRLMNIQQDLVMCAGYQALFVLEPLCREHYGFKGKLNLDEAELGKVVSLLHGMDEEQTQRSAGYHSLLSAYFMQLVVLLSRSYTLSAKQPTTAMLRLANAVSYLESHYQEPLTLEELAKQAKLSKNQFVRIFKKAFGTTPIDYLIDLRIQKAKKLLEQSSRTISQVAFEVGFSDSNYFSRQFQYHLGISPSEYRKQFGWTIRL